MNITEKIDLFLNEKTYNISKDVDYIYNLFYKQFIKDVEKNNGEKIKNNINAKLVISSEMLKSKQSQKANEVNPINIICTLIKGNFYDPRKQEIILSLNPNAINLLIERGNFESIKNYLTDDSFIRFKNEFSKSSIKGSIYHELSHWLNDSLHNQNLYKELKKRENKKTNEPLILHHIEIDAQIHAIKQLKRDNKNIWEFLSWMDIIKMKPSFFNVFYTAVEDKNKYEKFMKKFVKRLNREKLLGAGLMNIPTWKEMIEILEIV